MPEETNLYTEATKTDRSLVRLKNKACKRLTAALLRIPAVSKVDTRVDAGYVQAFVTFDFSRPQWLYIVGRAIDRNYGGYGFRCELHTTDEPTAPLYLYISSESGIHRGPELRYEEAFQGAIALAERIEFLMSPEAGFIRAAFIPNQEPTPNQGSPI